MHCPKCGSKIKSSDKFCPGCGRVLKKGAKRAPAFSVSQILTWFKTNKGKKFFLISLLILAIFLLGVGIAFYNPIREKMRFQIFKYRFKKSQQEKLRAVLETRYYTEAKNEALEWSQEAKIGRFRVIFHRLQDETPTIAYTFVDPYAKKTLRLEFDAKGEMKKEEAVNDLNSQKMMAEFPSPIAAAQVKDTALVKLKEMTDKEISFFNLDLDGVNDYWEFKATVSLGDEGNKEAYCRIFFDGKIECEPFGDKLIHSQSMKANNVNTN